MQATVLPAAAAAPPPPPQQQQTQAATAGSGSVLGSETGVPRPQVVIVTGPTAVGKTAISLMLAQRLQQPRRVQLGQQQGQRESRQEEEQRAPGGPRAGGGGAADGAEGGAEGGAPPPAAAPVAGCGRGEVISADSVQVYRGLDVGSDKLPPSERQGVPHHLIDVRDPTEDFSAGEFFECARPVAEDILRRGGVPLVVGGTGLYLRWFVVGKGGAPRATPEATAAVEAAMRTAWAEAEAAKRTAAAADAAAADAAAAAGGSGIDEAAAAGREAAAAEAEAGAGDSLSEEEKWEAAAALLLKWGDEVAYGRIRAERNNYYRLGRALSILAMHPGARLADFEPRADPDQELDYDFRCFFLHRPRLQLYDRIAARVEEMVVGGGLLEEAAMLLRRGLAPGENMAAKAIGYRQAMEWLAAAKARSRGPEGRPVGLADLCALHASICQATHKLVRSQMTYFRDDPMYRWIDVEGRDPRDVVDEIQAELAKPLHEGGCGDSGRLSKEEQKAIMRYRPHLKLLTEANAAAAAKTAAAAAAAAATAAAATAAPAADAAAAAPQPPQPSRPPKPKSKTALAAEAAAEAQLAPLLTRINQELLPGIPDAALAAAAAAGDGGPGGKAGAEDADADAGGGRRAMEEVEGGREAKRSRSGDGA